VSFRTWLESRSGDREAIDNIALFVAEAMLTKPAHAFSLLQALLMAASAGGFEHLLDADFILDRRVVGGLQRVATELAERLGDAVRLGRPVRRLQWDAEGVTAHSDDLRVTARRALIAVPPNLYERIAYEPPLPRHRRQLHQHLSLGLVIKVHATYATPFWREAGLSGTAFSPYQLVHEAYDNTNFGDERGTLVGFVSDERADRLLALPADGRKSAILASLASYYGPTALDPLAYYESDWAAEEWTGGAFGASYDLGGLGRYGPSQAQPVGPVWFGSSDLAGVGYQHVDGAIRVGIARAGALAESLATADRNVA
jgi:putrescine oxidase